jgi:TolA-binding protein
MRHRKSTLKNAIPLLAAVAMVHIGCPDAIAQEAKPATQSSDREQRLASRASAKVNAEAAELFRTADTTYLVGDLERAAELYRQILTVAPGSIFTIRATARLGDCAYEAKAFAEAVRHYHQAGAMTAGVNDPEELAAAIRADYMVGQSHLLAKQQTQAFGAFRRFIDRHPQDPLVNKAYQSIGDAHMAIGQFSQALDAYRMVGTVMPKAERATNRIAPGQRLYLRVNDADVNISDTPRSVYAKVTTRSGDSETVELAPLGLRSPVFIATVPTLLGKPIQSERLTDAFAADGEAKVRDLLVKAKQQRELALEKSRTLAELQRQGAGADPAGFEKQRSEIDDQIARCNRLAIEQEKQAIDAVDQGYARIEKLLIEWSPDQSLASVRERLLAEPATTQPAPESTAVADPSMASALAKPLATDEDEKTIVDPLRRGLTQAEIDRIRITVADTPTDLASLDKRLVALSLWHRGLSRQFQRLEIKGDDQITVTYTDQIGPNGPNDAKSAIRTDVVEVASDAHLAMLTSDGEQPIQQAVLGGSIRIRIEDADRDVTDNRDKVTITISALQRPDQKALELRAATEAKAKPPEVVERETPGLIAPPTTQPSEIEPLTLPDTPSITIDLTETSDHSGVFDAVVTVGSDGIRDGSQHLKLDPRKQIRVAYQDDRAIRRVDRFVHTAIIDCMPDRGGDVSAVRYRQTQLDLQAKLARAVASGEIGKIYLELGLASRGKQYLANAQADCREVSAAAGKASTLGEQALYHSWRIYFYAGLLDESVAAANRLIQAYPTSEYCDDAMLAIGQASLEKGKRDAERAVASGKPASLNRDLQRAVNQLDQLVKNYPSSSLAPEALYLIGQAKISAGQTGLDAFEQLAKQFPDSGFAARGLVQAADYYVSIGDFRRAQEYFGRVLIDYPDSADRGDVLLRRGVCQFKLGQHAEALATMYQVAEEHSEGDLGAQARKYINAINASRGGEK